MQTPPDENGARLARAKPSGEVDGVAFGQLGLRTPGFDAA
jgi:hypothetical protein